YRLDNLLFDPLTGEVTAVDWQTAAIGPPLRDVAYFLGTSLQTEDRRSNEEELVRQYHSALIDRAVAGYSLDQCWNDYRLGQLQGPMITVIGCIHAAAARTKQSDAMFLAMARRSCSAVRELGSLDLV
ncbi:MAG TPA: oxidoreductase family protein, partial [Acidimicrobiales bacterium]|nr:oxidoreductase family protein [Acidimicrobiales bacterium]